MDREELLKRALEDLGKTYPNGLYEYLFKHRHEVYSELTRLEKGIDKAFLSGTVGDLKAVLRDYWKLHIEAIREFKQVDHFDLPMAKQEMEEERLRV